MGPRRARPLLAAACACLAVAVGAASGSAQPVPPPPPVPVTTASPPTTPSTPTATATATGGATSVPSPMGIPSAVASPEPSAAGSPATAGSPVPGAPLPTPSPVPTPTPTLPPIVVDPPRAAVVPGASQTVSVMGVLGAVGVRVADPSIADATIDQETRQLTIVGKTVGTTIVTVTDARGLTRDVPVRVAYPAGTIGDTVSIRVTGRPASPEFLREVALAAALKAVSVRTGAAVVATPGSIAVSAPLQVDDTTTLDVPIVLQGTSYFTVSGTTHVRVENFAQPPIRPGSLLVSDYPETLKENGTLFTAELTPKSAARFLYYHYNPPGQPPRRIVLRVRNPSASPALVQLISGEAGPSANEMEVGHLSTQRFLVRDAANEGVVLTVPANATATVLAQELPPKATVSGLLQLHEIAGAPLQLALLAEDANVPDADAPASAELLSGDHPHARGIYPIPEFFFDYRYDADGPDLEIPIGQIPLPNLVQGQTLAGDYGVLQALTVRIVNNDRRNAREIAIYASPRGGRATGTFIIDRVLVQAHAMPPYGHYKLRQYTIPPGSYVRTEIVTMPEGGSSYPLRLIVAPDDGSASPGDPDSLVY
jgi:hypothetical protein